MAHNYQLTLMTVSVASNSLSSMGLAVPRFLLTTGAFGQLPHALPDRGVVLLDADRLAAHVLTDLSVAGGTLGPAEAAERLAD